VGFVFTFWIASQNIAKRQTRFRDLQQLFITLCDKKCELTLAHAVKRKLQEAALGILEYGTVFND
jgi:hypothetical protein